MVAVLSVLCAIAFAAQTVGAWYRLRHFKGPFPATFSNIWQVRALLNGQMNFEVLEANRKYGSLVRIGPNMLVTDDPALMRKMNAVRSPYRRSDWYTGLRFDPTRDNVLSQMDEDTHTELRTKMAIGYAGKENEIFEHSINHNVLALIKLIDSKYITTNTEYRPMDFGRKAQYFTLDVISHVAYGKPFGFLDTDTDLYQYIATSEKAVPAAMMVTIFPWLNYVLTSSFMKSLLPSATDAIGFGKIIGFTKEVVDQRFGPDAKDQRDMLGSFIRHGLTRDEAESETLLQIIAGSDTTATAIRTTFLYIITTPRVHAKLLAEISDATLSSPISDVEARTLPYLQAVIKEGLRIWPPAVGLMAKKVPPEGDTINGMYVPGGTSIGYGGFSILRNKKIWGEDADVFRPERWLEGEGIKVLEQTWEVIFNAGRYQCLGKNVALMELNKVFVELLRHFEFSVVDPTNPWKSMCMGIFAQSEMWLLVTRREKLL
ncbi:pisatin demethylase [Leptodontidium sp. 2 PMI_412]|nr:pisatin demethylase [Leptodontidium sp. 2 PMI_412]